MSELTSDVVETAERRGIDRREALKRGAIAAGVVAWAAPTVQALTATSAGAQTGQFTNCFPTGNLGIILTGSTCDCVPLALRGASFGPSCCSNHTFFLAKGTADCGARCNPADIVFNSVTAPEYRSQCDDGEIIGASYAGGFPDLGNCSGTVVVSIGFTITCADGIPHNCTYSASFDCDEVAGPCTVVYGTNGTFNCVS